MPFRGVARAKEEGGQKNRAGGGGQPIPQGGHHWEGVSVRGRWFTNEKKFEVAALVEREDY